MMKEQMNEEADYFARCLLMPKEKFVELFENTTSKYWKEEG